MAPGKSCVDGEEAAEKKEKKKRKKRERERERKKRRNFHCGKKLRAHFSFSS